MGISWKHNGPAKSWANVKSNADGTKLIAYETSTNNIYLSTDSGVNWTVNTAAGSKSWTNLCISADGTKMAACVNNGSIWTSSNSGSSWTERTGAGTRAWKFVACSPDGTRLVAGVYNGYAYTSVDSGATWLERTSAGILYWKNAVVSTTYEIHAFACDNTGDSNTLGYVRTSTDMGANWSKRTSSGPRRASNGAIAASTDGAVIYIGSEGDYGKYFAKSTDHGASWSTIDLSSVFSNPSASYTSFACNSTGSIVWANIVGGSYYISYSSDGGATWSFNAMIYYYYKLTCPSSGSSVFFVGGGNQSIESGIVFNDSTDVTAPVISNSAVSVSSIQPTTAYASVGYVVTDNSDTTNFNNNIQHYLYYDVYRSLSNNISTIADAKANGTKTTAFYMNQPSLSMSGLTPDTTYYVNFIVRDVHGNEAIFAGNSFHTLTPDVSPPTPGNGGVFTTTYIGQYGVDFQVPNPTDDRDPVYTLSCDLYRSTSNNISTVSDLLANGTYCTNSWWDEFNGYASIGIGGLSIGTSYYFNILTADSTGNKAVYQALHVNTLPESVIPTLPIGAPSTLVTFGQGTESSLLINQGNYGTDSEYIGRIYTFTSAFKGQLTLKFKVRNATGNQYMDGGSIQGTIFNNTPGYPEMDTYPFAYSNNSYSYQMGSGSPELEPSEMFNEVSFVFNNLTLAAGTYRLCMKSTFSNLDGGLTLRTDTDTAVSGTATHGIQYQSAFDDNYTANITLAVVKADEGVVNVAATATNSVDLTWTKATDNITAQANLRYAVYRYTDGTLSSASQVESTATLAKAYTLDINSATINGLAMGTTYWFYVLVKDEAQNKTMYLPLEVTTSAMADVTEPTIGTAISYTNNTTGNSVTVNWGAASDDVTSQANLLYKVVRATSSAAIDTIAEANAIVSGSNLIMDWAENTLSADAVGLVAGGTYYFSVLVKDTSENMSLYSPAVVIMPDTVAPTVGLPISYSNVTPTTITVSWGAASDNVTSPTQLQYKLVKASTAAEIDTIAEADAISGSGLVLDWSANVLTSPATVSGVTYFAVLVKDLAGNKSLYEPAASAVDSTPPTPVGSVTVSGVGPNFASISWGRATDDITNQSQLRYAVYRHSSGSVTDVATLESTGSVVMAYAVNRTNASITGLPASTSCWFYVVVKDAFDNKAMYPVVNIITSSASDPVVITGETVVDSVGGVIEVPATTTVSTGGHLILNVNKLSDLQKTMDNTGTSTITVEPGATISLGNGETFTVHVKTIYKLRIL